MPQSPSLQSAPPSTDVDILYLISNSFSARMILQSNLLGEIKRRGLRVAVMLPYAATEMQKVVAERYGVVVVRGPVLTRLNRMVFGSLKQYISEDVRKNPALFAKHLFNLHVVNKSLAGKLRLRGLLILNRLLVAALPGARKRVLLLAERALRNEEAAACLSRVNPALVVATYPVDRMESVVIYEAARQGINTAGQLLSWDNVTSKGHFITLPAWFLAWGPIMKEELHEYYGIADDRVLERGVAHFDAHLTSANDTASRAIVASLGLDQHKPYILFGMSTPAQNPSEFEIVETLARWIGEDRFGPDMQLVVRPHPHVASGQTQDRSWRERLDRLVTSARVALDLPLMHAKAELLLDDADLHKIVNLIRGCAVSINSGSTLAIDSICQDKPVILTMFDLQPGLPWWRSARRLSSYIHLAKIINCGGISVVRSLDELAAAINLYLDNPSAHAAARRATLARELHQFDGGSAKRIAETLQHLVAVGRRS